MSLLLFIKLDDVTLYLKATDIDLADVFREAVLLAMQLRSCFTLLESLWLSSECCWIPYLLTLLGLNSSALSGLELSYIFVMESCMP